MEPAITTDIVVAYSQCPRKAYLLLFSPDKGEPHEYVQILEQQRCANQERYVDRLKQTHADVQPYSLEHLRKGSKVLINAHLQVDEFAADCSVLTRVEGTSTLVRTPQSAASLSPWRWALISTLLPLRRFSNE